VTTGVKLTDCGTTLAAELLTGLAAVLSSAAGSSGRTPSSPRRTPPMPGADKAVYVKAAPADLD